MCSGESETRTTKTKRRRRGKQLKKKLYKTGWPKERVPTMCSKATGPWRKISAFTEAKEKQGSKRIILLGSTKCGKTAFLCRFLKDLFLEDTYSPTIEDLHSKRHIYKGKVKISKNDLFKKFIDPILTAWEGNTRKY